MPENLTDDEAAARLLARAPLMPCAYCHEPMVPGDPQRHPTRDHIWPKAMRSITAGRSGTLWCCATCNLKKGAMSPAQWLAHLEEAQGDGSPGSPRT